MRAHPKVPAKKLPVALAKRATAAAKTSKAKHAARARELLLLVRDKVRGIGEAFWDIGVALAQLRSPSLYTALGHASFEALIENETTISLRQAQKLVAITEQLPRSKALTLGQEKAAALVALSAATKAADTAGDLTKRPIALSGVHGKTDASAMSVREIQRAARELRRARAPKNTERARAVREAEGVAKDLVKALEGKGVEHARAEVLVVHRKGEEQSIALRVTVPMAARKKLKSVL